MIGAFENENSSLVYKSKPEYTFSCYIQLAY